MRTAADKSNTALGRLKSSAAQGSDGIARIKTAATNADGGLGKARTGSDKLKSSLDKLKSAAKGAHGELKTVKAQADAVEKSVGKAAKNADTGGKSMGNLGKGLKGASLAQKGLNLAMAASPFGLLMTLLTPLIAQFVNMDKITAVLRKGFEIAMKHIGSALGSLVKNAGPLLKGLGNALLSPWTGLAMALNSLFGILAGIRIEIPDWVPKYGGRGFSFPRLSVPVPRLATGGVVQARHGGTLALLGEAGEHEAVIPLSKLDRMIGSGSGLRNLTAAVEKLAARPVVVQVDSQEIARAVFLGQRQLARR
ncbi:hypothetical protein [Streptomyces sp. GQFP]|uniref:hypothetical protein n=1 Tax=Streptomyces sp. GQFP TaxID=2907545 RepID=UPI001F431495|nr:hypothetical protein [Streptomyces sp. GQFP]UIX31512.1 hypothetical protein LUX31_16515 [Streptomyces sp. GQFP]